MGDTSKRVDIDKLFLLANDLIGILSDDKDCDHLICYIENTKLSRSFHQVDALETNISLEECQKQVNGCKEKIEKAKSEAITVSKLDDLQTEAEEKIKTEHLLREELRMVSEELDSLEIQKTSFKERWKVAKQREKDAQKSHDSLSMCASVTQIIPDHTDKTKISGLFVEKGKKNKVERFEFEPTISQFEVCNRLWKMDSQC